MKILDNNTNLDNYLKSHKQKNIRIVTAFASGTEKILTTLLKNNNEIELLVGTINAFTSPEFIKYCVNHDKKNLKAFVDFRYQKSIHWKLYLISPNIVVVGSSNFTMTGVSLARDTCLVVENEALYKNYSKRFQALLKNEKVIEVKSEGFEDEFNAYCIKHKETQAGMVRSRQYSTLKEWLSDETNQSLPLLILEGRHTEETIKEADKLYQKNTPLKDEHKPKDFYTYHAKKNKLPFKQGDVVLCAGKRGGFLGFKTFDRIIYNKGRHFIFLYRQNSSQHPFSLNGLQEKFKKVIPSIYQREATHIDRNELQEILLSTSS